MIALIVTLGTGACYVFKKTNLQLAWTTWQKSIEYPSFGSCSFRKILYKLHLKEIGCPFFLTLGVLPLIYTSPWILQYFTPWMTSLVDGRYSCKGGPVPGASSTMLPATTLQQNPGIVPIHVFSMALESHCWWQKPDFYHFNMDDLLFSTGVSYISSNSPDFFEITVVSL